MWPGRTKSNNSYKTCIFQKIKKNLNFCNLYEIYMWPGRTKSNNSYKTCIFQKIKKNLNFCNLYEIYIY